MKWYQVRQDQNQINFRSSKANRENLMVPMLSKTQKTLDELPQGGDENFIFLNYRTGKPYISLQKPLKTALSRAGVPRFIMHHIRHLTTTLLLKTIGDPDLVQLLMGWSNQVMIKRYGHLSNQAINSFKSLEQDLL